MIKIAQDFVHVHFQAKRLCDRLIRYLDRQMWEKTYVYYSTLSDSFNHFFRH